MSVRNYIVSALAIIAFFAGIELRDVNSSASLTLLIIAAGITLGHVLLGLRVRVRQGTLPYNLTPGLLMITAGILIAAVSATIESRDIPKLLTYLMADIGLALLFIGFVVHLATRHSVPKQ